ncbi:GNAT family N-acetyltransferase [Archangium sp.]|uniref:GNAT family N-acetyltransferase n=1 Tax=Archangium sp. TaxID=1872627 RepID=UPI002D756E76|nr:GNAT family N-acetyltransferase [Archangium sp.]HYO52168.1 GNAT family N-acetyltransferase [Archangium sp.]
MSRHASIREFDASDREGVRHILREAWAQSKAGETALMASVDGQPAGVLVTRRVRGVDCILALYIHPKFQRRGLGRALLSHAVSKESEAAIVEAQVLEASTQALAFYGALGFAEVSRRRMALPAARTAGVVVVRLARAELTSAP